jgi:4-amino-4-deoxy-L-arabinose transferase-like glycosyltransferase
MDKDQERPAAYVLDMLQHGHWLCPHDWTGAFASKPPMSVWLGALASRWTGGVSLASLWLPGASGIIGTAVLIAAWTGRIWGWRAALFGSASFLLAPLPMKLIGLNRTDGFFTLTVALTAAAAWRAWNGAGWLPFWAAGAVATLTKGPLGVLLGAMGLLAELWERRDGRRATPWGAWWSGCLFFLALTGGWLGAAVIVEGSGVLKRMLGAELVGHAVDPAFGWPGRGLAMTPGYFLVRFAPWSLFALLGATRACKRPSVIESARRLERFATVWLLAGLAVFAVATHQRGDLVAPLLPAAAMLAGCEIARLTKGWTDGAVWRGSGALAAGGLACCTWVYILAPQAEIVHRSDGIRLLAAEVRRIRPDAGIILTVGTPFAFQAHLNQIHADISYDNAAEILMNQPGRLVAVDDLGKLRATLPDFARKGLHVVARWPESPKPFIAIAEFAPFQIEGKSRGTADDARRPNAMEPGEDPPVRENH